MKSKQQKRILLVLTLLLLVCSGCSTQEQTESVVLNPATTDLGVVNTDKKMVISFDIVNNTDEDRRIRSQAKSCGCTNLHLTSKLVSARNKVKVRLVFDPKNESGNFEKSAFFRLDNGEMLVFKFKGSKSGKQTT